MTIHIEHYGEGLPLVLFHGWAFDSTVWAPLTVSLSKNFKVILVDLPGFGYSKMQEWEEFKAHLLGQLPNKFILVGWSLGGLYASRLAVEASSRVLKLVNIGSSPYFIKDHNWPAIEATVFERFYHKLANDAAAVVRDFITLHIPNKAMRPDTIDIPDVRALRNGLHQLQHWDLRENVFELKMPVCYMFGRLDSIVPFRMMHHMKAFYPDFNYCSFQKSAHMPFYSQPNDFIEQLECFCHG